MLEHPDFSRARDLVYSTSTAAFDVVELWRSYRGLAVRVCSSHTVASIIAISSAWKPLHWSSGRMLILIESLCKF